MQGAALLISSLSIVSKEALYHYTLHVGEESNSDSVSAPRVHANFFLFLICLFLLVC